MKKCLTAVIAIWFLPLVHQAQNHSAHEMCQSPTVLDAEDMRLAQHKLIRNKPETAIWSEDFANGIPNTWSNEGYDSLGLPLANALWEYRGLQTVPNNLQGSRGAFSGINNTPPSNLPILSPTANNGFVIFDSDWRDNGGVAGAAGTGSAPAPHIATLTTPIIDLQNNPYVELSFYSFHRYFEGRALIAFSSDSGMTWPDTILAHPGIGVNVSSPRDAWVTINASPYIGNAQNAQIRFIFDGTYDDPGANGAGNGYYFWMIDDLEINPLPKFELRFTSWGCAPDKDVLMEPVFGQSSKKGRMIDMGPTGGCLSSGSPIVWDCNAYNYGSDSLHNVYFKVDVLDEFNIPITSLAFPNPVNLGPGDSLSNNILNTYNTPWLPTSPKGMKKWVYTVVADSAQALTDTVLFYFTDTLTGLDFSQYHNRIGTPNIGKEGSAIAVRIDYNNQQHHVIKHVWIGIAPGTVPGGILAIDIFDTTDFDVLTPQGYPTNGLKGTQIDPSGHTITAADVAAGFVQIPITDGLNPFLVLPPHASYYVSVVMFSNNGQNPIYIKNDQTFQQVTKAKVFKSTIDQANIRWYFGFQGNRNMNSPWIRTTIFSCTGNIEESYLMQRIKINPNPASSFVYIFFEEISGNFTLTITDITGRTVSQEKVNVLGGLQHSIDVNGFAKGVYMLNINNGKASFTHKIIVQ